MRHPHIFALSLCALVACAPEAPSEGDLSSLEQPVYLGQANPGDPAVVALTYFGSSFCSGTLITPRVVLTAAHCLPPNDGDFSEITVFFGADTSEAGVFVPAVDGWRNPFWHDNSLYYDIGLLRLAEDGPVEPMAWHEEGDAYGLGDPARIVGFGIVGEDQGGGGLKREGTALVDDLDPHVMTLAGDPSGTCSGDSGGATIMDLAGVDTLVGVHSRADCVGVSIEMRTDKYADDIQEFIGHPACAQNGQCALNCPFPDPDCPCANDGFCTDLCDDLSTDPDCPEQCVEDGFCDGTCDADPDCPCIADESCQPSCIADPDCGCEADGFCATGCSTPDPDCSAEPSACAEDGQCDASCAADPDCAQEAPPVANGASDAGGCTTRPGRRDDVTPLWLLALGVIGLRRRR